MTTRYEVLVTRNVTQSTRFRVEASTKADAAGIALSQAKAGEGDWDIDEGNHWDDVYLCDSIEECVQECDFEEDDQEILPLDGQDDPLIDLGIGICIEWDGKNRENAILSSTLLENCTDEPPPAIASLCSMVLGHFQAGVNVQDPRYILGVKMALEACKHN